MVCICYYCRETALYIDQQTLRLLCINHKIQFYPFSELIAHVDTQIKNNISMLKEDIQQNNNEIDEIQQNIKKLKYMMKQIKFNNKKHELLLNDIEKTRNDINNSVCDNYNFYKPYFLFSNNDINTKINIIKYDYIKNINIKLNQINNTIYQRDTLIQNLEIENVKTQVFNNYVIKNGIKYNFMNGSFDSNIIKNIKCSRPLPKEIDVFENYNNEQNLRVLYSASNVRSNSVKIIIKNNKEETHFSCGKKIIDFVNDIIYFYNETNEGIEIIEYNIFNNVEEKRRINEKIQIHHIKIIGKKHYFILKNNVLYEYNNNSSIKLEIKGQLIQKKNNIFYITYNNITYKIIT